MTLIYLALVGYVPGALLYRAPIADRPRRASLAAEERAFWAVMISVILSTTIALTLGSMGVYSLRNLAACNAVVGMLVAVASRGDLSLGPPAPGPTWTAALPAALILLGAWMYFAVPASEYVLGGRDPGVYINEGIQIAQRQSLATPDGVAAAVPASDRDLFFPEAEDAGYFSVRFMGFHLRDPDTGSVTGQFPQGYPIWIAIAYGLDGLTGARRVTAWLAILGVLAVYFAAQRLIGPVAAAAAAGLLAVHVIQTWYARYPNSEIATQALLFAALLAHAYAHEEDDRFFGPIAASLLGIAVFTRLPAVFALAAAVAASLIAPANGHRTRLGFLMTLAAWMGLAALYYTTQLRPYFNRPLSYVQSLHLVHLIVLAAGCAMVAGLVVAIRKPSIAAATRKSLPVALICGGLAAAVYAFFFREPGPGTAPHDADALRMFVDLYFTRLAFALALGGYALVVWRSFWRAPALLLAVTATGFFFFYKMRIWPEHFWLARRFVDVVLPAGLICVSGAVLLPLSQTFSGRRWPRTLGVVRVAAGLVLIGLLGQRYLVASGPVRSHIEYAGIIPKLEQLAGRFGDDDLVILEAREASDVHVLGLPLAYIYARNVLVLHRSRPDKASMLRFLTWAHTRYKNVYFIAGGGTDLLSPGVGAEVVEGESFQVPEFEQSAYNVYPRSTRLKPFDFTIYKLTAASSAPVPHSLDVGGADDLFLVDFHPKERLGGGNLTFRWSQERSFLLMGAPAGSRELVLKLANGRPPGVPAPKVAVYIDDEELGTAEPTRDFRDYAFALPGKLAAALAQRTVPSEIRIQSTTWNPQQILGGPDNRQLGVMVDRAEIR